MKNMSESAISAISAKQIFANFAKFVKPICGTTRRSEGSMTEAEYPTNNQRISNLLLTIRPFRVAILAVLLVFVGSWNSEVWAGAGDITFYASIEASPSTGGTVSLSPGTSQKKNSSYNWRGYYEQTSATFSYKFVITILSFFATSAAALPILPVTSRARITGIVLGCSPESQHSRTTFFGSSASSSR